MPTPSNEKKRPAALPAAFAAAIVASLIAVAPAARADDPTAEDAQKLEQDMRAWIGGLLGPTVPLGALPWAFTAEGDHIKMEIPLPGKIGDSGVTVEGPAFSAELKPLDGGRWALSGVHTPSPMHVTFPSTGPDSLTDAKITIDGQDVNAEFDPSLATASTWDGTVKGYTSVMSGAGGQGASTTHMDQIVTHLSWQPGTDGRINVLQDGEGSGFSSAMTVPGQGPFSFLAEHMRVNAHIDGVAPDRFTTILHSVIDMGAAAAAGGKTADGKLTPEQKAKLRVALVAMSELVSGFDEQITLDNMTIDAGGHGGKLAKLAGGLGLGAPDGKLGFRFNIAMDGLDSPEIPPGPMRTFLPHHFAYAQHIGGVPAEDVKTLLLKAVDSDGNDPEIPAMAMGMLAKGPVVFGVDELAFDFGPAALAAKAEVQVSGPTQYAGTAHIVINGMEDLMKQVSAEPMFKDGEPVLIMLKGLGKPDGKAMVWDIAYKDNKLLVNGNDMSAMLPK